jgi:hypothetical protein
MDITRSVALSLLLLIAGPAAADVLLVDSIQSAPALQTPQAGTSMAAVRQQYGSAVTEYPTVSVSGGHLQPPITRWDYSGFSVFFEHDRVVHSVVHRASGN